MEVARASPPGPESPGPRLGQGPLPPLQSGSETFMRGCLMTISKLLAVLEG